MPDAPTSLTEDEALRSSTTLGFTWSDGSHNGGQTVESYRIQQRVVGGSFSVVASGVTSKTYTAQSLTLGTEYEFTVESYNAQGFSSPSATFTILHALPPVISAPTTSNSGQNIIVDWTAADAQGSAVTSYLVELRQSDGTTFSTDATNCDGSDSTIMANTECTIPLSVLTAAPFSLTLNTDIYARVTATNSKGSTTSVAGTGAHVI